MGRPLSLGRAEAVSNEGRGEAKLKPFQGGVARRVLGPASQGRARGRPGDWEALSRVARVFLLCCSCAPLVLRWHPPPYHGGPTALLCPLDSAGLVVIQRKSHFPMNALPTAVPLRCQSMGVATLTGLEPVPPP